MGYALAAAAVRRGWKVDLVSGPVSLAVAAGGDRAPRDLRRGDVSRVQAAVQTLRPVHRGGGSGRLPPPGCLAAEAPEGPGRRRLELVPTIDILKTLAARRRPGQIVVGFAAETHNVAVSARRKLKEKKLDWIVANDVSRPGLGMGSEKNAVLLFAREGAPRSFGPAPKSAVAEFILRRVVGRTPA